MVAKPEKGVRQSRTKRDKVRQIPDGAEPVIPVPTKITRVMVANDDTLTIEMTGDDPRLVAREMKRVIKELS